MVNTPTLCRKNKITFKFKTHSNKISIKMLLYKNKKLHKNIIHLLLHYIHYNIYFRKRNENGLSAETIISYINMNE